MWLLEYLDNNAFEQMAREYYKKYCSSVSVLEQNNELFNNLKEIFIKIIKLLNCLETNFNKYNKFNTFFENSKKFKNDLKEYVKENFNEELLLDYESNRNVVNHKFCANSMIEIFIDIFRFNTYIVEEIDKIKNILLLNAGSSEVNLSDEKQKLDYLTAKLYEVQEIFKIFTETLKHFYSII